MQSRLLALDQVDEEAVERRDAHAAPCRRVHSSISSRRSLTVKSGCLGGVGDHRDDQLVEDAQAPLDEIEVSVVHRIEHPGIHGALAHEVPRRMSDRG